MIDWLINGRTTQHPLMTQASYPNLPIVLDPLALSSVITEPYRNSQLTAENDHEIRMSVMTGSFQWHRHPDSDESFYCIDGQLIIEFPDGEVCLRPGQFLTVPAGMLHRTRPAGDRSVNLTFERAGAETQFED